MRIIRFTYRAFNCELLRNKSAGNALMWFSASCLKMNKIDRSGTFYLNMVNPKKHTV